MSRRTMMIIVQKIAAGLLMLMFAIAPAFAGKAEEVKKLQAYCPDLGTIQKGDITGTYYGLWGDKLPHLLTVVQVEGEKVKAFYSTGVYKPWGINKGYCSPVEGSYKDGQLSFTFMNGGIKVFYRFDGNKAVGSYDLPNGKTPGVFQRFLVDQPDGQKAEIVKGPS